MKNITEHQLVCKGCGKILDKRDLNEIICHGWIENGEIICYDDTTESKKHTGGSKKVGESVEWNKDKKLINLN